MVVFEAIGILDLCFLNQIDVDGSVLTLGWTFCSGVFIFLQTKNLSMVVVVCLTNVAAKPVMKQNRYVYFNL